MLAVVTPSAGVIQLWETNPLRRVGELEFGDNRVTALAVSPDGKTLAVATRKTGDQPRDEESVELRFWDLTTNRAGKHLKGHARWVQCLAFSPDGKWLASSDMTQSMRIWEADSGASVGVVEYHQLGNMIGVRPMVFSPDSKYLVGINWNEVLVWGTGSWQPETRLVCGVDQPHCLAFSPDGSLLAVGGTNLRVPSLRGGKVEFWEVEGWRNKGDLWRHKGQVGVDALAFSPDGTRLATGDTAGEVGVSPLP
jgi:WD40 repeat protein